MSKTKDEENSNKVERISTLFDCLDSTYFTTNSNKLIDLHLDPRRTRLSDFKVISLLSKGAFGEVYLVSKDDKPYALKRVLKETVNRQPSTALHMEEREILIKARESNFLVFAHCTFQDEGAIYFLMEYFPGGDFTNLLSNYGMEENQIRFYGAEILLALKELHSFNFVHRDLKPENLLITKEGHIKLCDFGSCAMLKDGKIKCDVTIGTPDYVSPEVLCSAEKMSEYGTEVDLWTFGTLLYEMVNEEPPFFSELLEETYERIKEISFTHENGSKELKDLINNLLVKKENRFTIQQVMDHPFFKGIDFENIYKSTPPRVPKISSIFDVSNFPEANRNICIVKSDKIDYKSFIGFSYDPFFTNEFIKEITLQNFSEEKKIVEEKKFIEEKNFTESNIKEKKVENLKSNFLQTETVCLNCKKKETLCLNCKNDCILRGECYFHKQKSILCLEMNCNKTIQCTFHKRNLSVCFSRKTLSETNLPLKLKKLSINNTSVNKIRNTLGELHYLVEKMYKFKNENAFKKEVKIKKIQIKEYQQKLEEQIVRNTFLEEEIFFLKNEINRLSKKRKESLKLLFTGVLAYKAKSKLENRLVGGEEIELKLENEGLTFKNEFYNLNNVIINQLSDKELSQMSNKVRNLILSFTFIEIKKKEKEKTNLKVVEENLKKEMKIKEGLEKMLKVMKGKSLEQTQEQLSGTIKRIEFLKNSLEVGRKLTDCSFEEYKESVKKYEFNNHSFKPTTFLENTLCEHCNDLLRGTNLQGLKCDDCFMIVHKKCFVLIKESCEMREAIVNGDKWYFMFGCVEDKERIYKAIGLS